MITSIFGAWYHSARPKLIEIYQFKNDGYLGVSNFYSPDRINVLTKEQKKYYPFFVFCV